eukprot:91842-Amphidinium_carterae.1
MRAPRKSTGSLQHSTKHQLTCYNIKRPPIEEQEYLQLVTTNHTACITAIGKLIRMCPLQPDKQDATKELTRTLQKPTHHDRKNLKHLLGYLQGAKSYKPH